jgi:predicted enzyme related to lactoylglutathione lyase
VGRVIHFEIHADDLDRAEDFYTGLFGWTVQRWEGAPVDYRLLATGAEGEPGIDGALMTRRDAAPDPAAGPRAFVCTIQVESIEDTESAVAEAGGRQVADRVEVPNVGLLSYFADTEGNVFGALEPA